MKKKELRDLQDLLRVGKKVPAGEYSAPETVITIQMPDGTTIGIKAIEVTVEVNRDYMDATTRYSAMRSFVVGPRTFTIKGKM